MNVLLAPTIQIANLRTHYLECAVRLLIAFLAKDYYCNEISFYCHPLGLLWGCQSALTHHPAILAEPNSDNTKQIKTIIEQALKSNNVLISQSVFTKSSQLIIQRKTDSLLVSPRFLSETEKPHYFWLFKNITGCFVQYEQSRWYLTNTDCVVDIKTGINN